MEIVIDTSGLDAFFNLPPEQMFWVFMANIGWIAIGVTFLIGVLQVYLFYIRTKWSEQHRHVLLAIDIPKGNEQSPKAVENMFTYLAGAHGSINFFEKWFEGVYQKVFSLEVVSLEGYTQFLIWTPAEFRNLVESAIYSQYADAEISEVDDYTQRVPQHFPDEEYDIWGVEFIQHTPWVYPIKVYKEFEHQMGPSETQFKDPMASLMDLCSSLREGEQFWFQIIVIPTGIDWVKDSEKEINKIFGKKTKVKPDLASKGLEALGNFSENFYSIWGDIEDKKKEEKSRTMMDLTPTEKRRVEGISEKAGKLGFEAKIRVVYVARKEVMNKAKVANGIVGFIKQFATLDMNNLKPDMKMTATKTMYFRKEPRLNVKKNKIFSAYVKRSDTRGRRAGLYNIEELATIWHFPVEANVIGPLVQKAPGRKADAPSALPLAVDLSSSLPDIFQTDVSRALNKHQADSETRPANDHNSVPGFMSSGEDLTKKPAAPPANLPTI